ncbi:acyl-CoA ligase (AMP-forming), exosortase A system-associated [Aurantiacibacter aquimixticola]|uniref:Acyl-CoA ligase (AMP-forming), exosortase A system-associated n=1 Tax=Aurantiacibacter aquimixticola TaxID=1958945 RepID=A0A419RS65_9SPHN|nr:acyl-CoA ligase (AMP-forming), exosortase A system-associated [Aurantiacibacter aquimixticola]RJY08609.1 acyl-CoA ligase (AMP-forming), exosortase A system-associated [Aurantiacibacter aquimixticola]
MSTAPDPVPRPLDHIAERGKDGDPALILRHRTLSWADLRRQVSRMAAWLADAVPEKGARVATWGSKGEATCLLPLAAARAGLVHVPINPLLKRAQVAHILADSGADLLIANAGRTASLEHDDVPTECKIVEEAAFLSGLGGGEGSASLSDLDPHSLAAILYTSGSTGRPKGVMLSHANLWLGAVSVAHYLEMERDDVTLAVLPLSFDYGQNQLLSTWYAGGSVVPLDYLTPRDVIKACARHSITTLAAVPPLWVQLAEQDWSQDAVGTMRRLTNSGGALIEDLVQALRHIFPQAKLFPMYGLTEAFRSTYLDPELVDTHPTSIGKAIPFAEILVIDQDGAAASDGELVHCGPLVAQGYWQDPERTAERFRPAPATSKHGGTAVWSGDTVCRDDDGLLYFVGREDAMIKCAGNRISPQEIEDAARATGLAEEAVAFGVPDPRLGHAIHLIVRGEGGDEALRAALRRELPNFMQPAHIEWVETMPLNPNGKIDRARLKRDAE